MMALHLGGIRSTVVLDSLTLVWRAKFDVDKLFPSLAGHPVGPICELAMLKPEPSTFNKNGW